MVDKAFFGRETEKMVDILQYVADKEKITTEKIVTHFWRTKFTNRNWRIKQQTNSIW